MQVVAKEEQVDPKPRDNPASPVVLANDPASRVLKAEDPPLPDRSQEQGGPASKLEGVTIPYTYSQPSSHTHNALNPAPQTCQVVIYCTTDLDVNADGMSEPGPSGRVQQANGPTLFSERHGPYTQRELFFQQQEAAGAFTFEYVENNGESQNNIW